MADLTSLYHKKPFRDKVMKSLVDFSLKKISENKMLFDEYGFMDLFDTQGGTQPPKKEFLNEETEGYIRFLQIRDFTSEKTPTYIPESKKNKLCNSDDVLLGRYGASVGKILTGKSGAYNVACAKLLIKDSSLVNNKFVFYLMHASIIQNVLTGITRGAQAGFNKNDLEKIRIKLPNISTQNLLIKVYEKYENLVLNKSRYSETFRPSSLFEINLEKEMSKLYRVFLECDLIKGECNKIDFFISKLRQSILQEAVQGKLTADWRKKNPNIESASELLKRIKKEKEHLIADKKIKKEKPLPLITKDEIPYEIPKRWKWCKLTDLVNVGTGSTPSKSNISYYLNGTIPWYTSSATNDLVAKTPETFITDKALKETNCKIFPKGSLVIAMYGQGKTRGQISELKIAGATNQAIAAMVFYEKSNCVRDYLKFYFRKMYDEIRLLAEGGAQPNLNVGKIKATLIPLPPKEEIGAIETLVKSLMMYCDQLEKQVEKSKLQAEQLMQAILQEVFNPEKRENSDDVVEALFPDLETIAEVANLQQAMIIQKTELGLGSGRGKVYAQKTSANLKNIFDVDIPYTFEKSHHGEFSHQLSDDLDKNPYLRKVKTEVGEIYEVKNNKQQEVLNALNKPENASFIQSIDELLQVYQRDPINGITDRIELLNTVWRAIRDTKSLIGNKVYNYLEEWEIQQGAFKTKADKFTKSETFAIITLIKDLGWDKKLI